MQAPKED
jgi:hypothetical protein